MSGVEGKWPFELGKSPFRVKGIAYRSALLALAEDADVSVESFVESIPEPEMRDWLSQRFLAASWYDVYPLVDLARVLARREGRVVTETWKENARRVAERDLGSIFRFLLRMTSPRVVASRLPQVSSRYFDFGRLEILESHDESVVLERTGTPSPIVQWYAIVTGEWVLEALRTSGASAAEYSFTREVAGKAHGVPTEVITLRFRWRG
ncbi:MAG TPA: hypothetical protein RMH99_08775 [Sandaracinaceae bacterium LLY-WYZ-13_1]|nr:hypothetical protein [Sandaracinaceae bacterium LLY-WYZ-13_1]